MDFRKTNYHYYVYHWDRIFAALVVLLLLIGGVGYAGYQWLSPAAEPVVAQTVGKIAAVEQPSVQAEGQDEEPAQEDHVPKAPGSGELQSAMVDDSTAEAPEAEAPGVSAAPNAVAPANTETSDTTVPLAGEASESAPPATGEAFDSTEPATTVASVAVPAPSRRAEVADDAPREPKSVQEDSPLAQASQPPPQKAMFRLQDVSVESPAVERFILAKSVINNEPRGDIQSITPKADGAAAIYCFSDVVGMKDKVLYYYWLRDGKTVAKVRVGAWGKRWRSHSSKILNPTMKGDWRVELRKADSTLLASAEFVYR